MIADMRHSPKMQLARFLFWALLALPLVLFALREQWLGSDSRSSVPNSAAVELLSRVYLWVSPSLVLIGVGLYSGEPGRMRLFLLGGLIYGVAIAAWMAWQLAQSGGGAT